MTKTKSYPNGVIFSEKKNDLLAPDYESPNDDNDLIVKVIMRIVKTLPQKKVVVNLVTKISELELKVLV